MSIPVFPPLPSGRGAGGEGNGSSNLREDCAEHLIHALHNLVILKAQHAKAHRLEDEGAVFVVCFLVGLRMHVAVDLNDEGALQAAKVDDIAADRMLAPKTMAGQPAVAQRLPQEAFRRRLFASKLPRSISYGRSGSESHAGIIRRALIFVQIGRASHDGVGRRLYSPSPSPLTPLPNGRGELASFSPSP